MLVSNFLSFSASDTTDGKIVWINDISTAMLVRYPYYDYTLLGFYVNIFVGLVKRGVLTLVNEIRRSTIEITAIIIMISQCNELVFDTTDNLLG